MSTATMSDCVCRIYVACLSSYNNGILHGKWIDANQDVDVIYEEIQEMLKQSRCRPAEETAIHDYEGFGDIHLSEYEDIETVSRLATAIEEHGEPLKAYISMMGDVDYAIEHFEEAYLGEYESSASYIEDLTRECNEIPSWLDYYIDWKSMARDSELNGDISVHEVSYDQVYIFNNHI